MTDFATYDETKWHEIGFRNQLQVVEVVQMKLSSSMLVFLMVGAFALASIVYSQSSFAADPRQNPKYPTPTTAPIITPELYATKVKVEPFANRYEAAAIWNTYGQEFMRQCLQAGFSPSDILEGTCRPPNSVSNLSAMLQPIAHREANDSNAVGLDRYYKRLSSKDPNPWEEKLDGALATIECGDPYRPKTAHLVRGARGGIRLYTSFHGGSQVIDWDTNPTSLMRACKVKLGPDRFELKGCATEVVDRGGWTTGTFRNHFLREEYREAFAVPQADYLAITLQCDQTDEGKASADRINSGAIRACGHSPVELESLFKDRQVRFASVGIVREKTPAGDIMPVRLYDDTGKWDPSLSKEYNACIYSNNTDSGMSGGFLAALSPHGVCAVCTINGESYFNTLTSSEGVPRMDPDSERTLKGVFQNSGSHYNPF